MALRMGKHVYCEKPLTHSVYEARVVAKLASEAKVATQMGTQIHATANYRRVVELVQSGAIGAGPRGPRLGAARPGPAARSRPSRPRSRSRSTGTSGSARSAYPAVPPDLPAPELAAVVGVRQRDPRRHGLPLHGPAVLGPRAPPPDDRRGLRARPSTPRRPPTGSRGPLRVPRPWREATPSPSPGRTATGRPDILLDRKLPRWANGVLFVGDKGMLLADYTRKILYPRGRLPRLQGPRADHPRLDRPPRRVDRRLQGRPADDLPLRLLGRPDRGRPPGDRRLSGPARSSNGTPPT